MLSWCVSITLLETLPGAIQLLFGHGFSLRVTFGVIRWIAISGEGTKIELGLGVLLDDLRYTALTFWHTRRARLDLPYLSIRICPWYGLEEYFLWYGWAFVAGSGCVYGLVPGHVLDNLPYNILLIPSCVTCSY